MCPLWLNVIKSKTNLSVRADRLFPVFSLGPDRSYIGARRDYP
jgi:hypothetical protein